MINLFPFTIIATFVVLTGAIISKSCDSKGENFYYDIGCTPYYIQSGSTCGCPDGFNCENIENKNDSCRYKGNYYKHQEKIKGTDKCMFCNCNVENNDPNIICAMPDCAPINVNENCTLLPSLDKCCSFKEICKNETKICKVDGIKYKQGHFFQPLNTCWNCMCTKDFDGTYRTPYCKKSSCDTEIWNTYQINNKCAPVFDKMTTPCCPSSFICNNGILSLEMKSKGLPTTVNVCKLGKRKFYKNDHFDVEYLDINDIRLNATCVCDLPPYPTCFN